MLALLDGANWAHIPETINLDGRVRLQASKDGTTKIILLRRYYTDLPTLYLLILDRLPLDVAGRNWSAMV
jgi:hypothetical protein